MLLHGGWRFVSSDINCVCLNLYIPEEYSLVIPYSFHQNLNTITCLYITTRDRAADASLTTDEDSPQRLITNGRAG